MHQKEKDFLKELNELELILKEYVDGFFVRGIKYSEGDKQRFYRFLEEYNQLKSRCYQYKNINAEHKAKKSKEFYESFFNENTFSPNHK